jgi:Domain of unknown function (DUF222)
MFDVVESVEAMLAAVDGLARGLDPAVVPASHAKVLVERIGRAERQLAGVKLRLAGRVGETALWRGQGHRSAAHWLAQTSGTSVGEAAGVLATAQRLEDLASTTDALMAGDLSRAQVEAVTDAAVLRPDAEAELLGVAQRESLKGLKDEAARVKQAGLDAEARYAAIHASRRLRFGADPDGAATLSLRTTPDAMAEIRASIEHHQRTIFECARAADRRAPVEAYAADALLAMARATLGGPTTAADGDVNTKPVATKVIVRVDHTALARGHTEPGDTCDIAGVGPVPVSVIDRIMASGDAFLCAVVTKGHDVISVAHLGRKPTAYQRTALDWTTPHCTVAGCDQPRREIDHRHDWAQTHHTLLSDLDGYCTHHHALKTRQNYQLEPGTGRRRMLAPAD